MHRKGLGMPIAQFVDDSEFDPETKRVMDAQFEMAREALQLGDERTLANERIARSIIELAKAGEHNADVLCESVSCTDVNPLGRPACHLIRSTIPSTGSSALRKLALLRSR
jgi:hypothetical protein